MAKKVEVKAAAPVRAPRGAKVHVVDKQPKLTEAQERELQAWLEARTKELAQAPDGGLLLSVIQGFSQHALQQVTQPNPDVANTLLMAMQWRLLQLAAYMIPNGRVTVEGIIMQVDPLLTDMTWRWAEREMLRTMLSDAAQQAAGIEAYHEQQAMMAGAGEELRA